MPQAAAIATIVAAAATTATAINSAVNAPDAPKVAPPKQGATAPDASNIRNSLAGSGQGGGSPGIAQTFLTGAGGVNPALLQLGSNSLLGGGTGAGSTPTVPGMG